MQNQLSTKKRNNTIDKIMIFDLIVSHMDNNLNHIEEPRVYLQTIINRCNELIQNDF